MSRTTADKSTVTTGGGRVIAVPGGGAPTFDQALSDFPNYIGSCVAWWDFSDTDVMYVDKTPSVKVANAGDNIVTILDKSNAATGCDMQLTNSTLTEAGTFVPNAQGNRGAILLSSANASQMVATSAASTVESDYSATGFTFAVVMNMSDGDTATLFGSARGNLDSQIGFDFRVNGSSEFRFLQNNNSAETNCGYSITSYFTTGQWLVLIYRSDVGGGASEAPTVYAENSTTALRQTVTANVVQAAATYPTVPNSASHTFTPALFSSAHSPVFLRVDGYVGELMLFNDELTDNQCDQLMSWLRMKWDI